MDARGHGWSVDSVDAKGHGLSVDSVGVKGDCWGGRHTQNAAHRALQLDSHCDDEVTALLFDRGQVPTGADSGAIREQGCGNEQAQRYGNIIGWKDNFDLEE